MRKLLRTFHLRIVEQTDLDNTYVSILLPGRFESSGKGLINQMAMPSVRNVYIDGGVAMPSFRNVFTDGELAMSSFRNVYIDGEVATSPSEVVRAKLPGQRKAPRQSHCTVCGGRKTVAVSSLAAYTVTFNYTRLSCPIVRHGPRCFSILSFV